MNNQQVGVFIGLDIGGTEIKGGIVSPRVYSLASQE